MKTAIKKHLTQIGLLPGRDKMASAMSSTVQQATRAATITLNGAIDDVFPLFTAKGELLWVPGWNPTFVYPQSGEPQTGGIFASQSLNTSAMTYWYTIIYDTERHIAQYVNIDPGSLIIQVNIRCQANPDNNTMAQVAFTFTPLRDRSSVFVHSQFSEAGFQAMMDNWVKWINYALEHGKPMPTSNHYLASSHHFRH